MNGRIFGTFVATALAVAGLAQAQAQTRVQAQAQAQPPAQPPAAPQVPPPAGQELSALARLDPRASGIEDLAPEAAPGQTSGRAPGKVPERGAGQGAISLRLALSQPVPFRVFMLDDPPRLVMDFREVAFDGIDPAAIDRSAHVTALRWGAFHPGWSRLVAELDAPYVVASAWQETAPTRINVSLVPSDAAGLAAAARAHDSEATAGPWALPAPAVIPAPHPRQDGSRPLRVLIDPGHGGLDPGAEAGGLSEAPLVLAFALQLRDLLIRAGMDVQMTRAEDVFVPLDTRVSVARAWGADLMLSVHADAIAEGEAHGATVYLLGAAAAAAGHTAEELAARHDRDDLLAGVDLDGHDDEVAGVLMDLARAETGPRSDRLAQALAARLKAAGLRMHRHPVQRADFTVLKAPDIPSVLLELGFLSSQEDRARLADPAWRERMAQAVLGALDDWGAADAAEARLLRQ
ncbi:N-acetylmuramoyl-L-alanine amidase [Frigidibacter sp. MR17.24]|uniref:N-acetylmuramoyl-L-alanine amidase n=1 Tax=Frigidibacter sp. MR17.24 TaxID=3127345 RepID=UPI00301302A1